MQGQESSITTFTEKPSFDHSSTSSDAAIQPQIPWNSVQTHHPENIISSSELSTLHHSFGEATSSAGQGQVSKGAFHPYDPSNSVPYNDGINSRANGKQIASGSSHSGAFVFPRDEDDDEFDNQLTEQLEKYPNSLDVLSGPSVVPSQSGGSVQESRAVPCSSFDGLRSSCKRKAVEVTHIGPSSGDLHHQTERASQWGSSSGHQNEAGINIITPAQIANDAVDESLSAGSLRNVRLRIDASPQQDNVPDEGTTLNLIERVVDASSSVPRDSSESRHATEGINIRESSPAPLSRVPYARRNSQSRWGASSSSSASEESNNMAREDLIAIDRSLPIPAVEIGSSSQEPLNVDSNGQNNGSSSSLVTDGSSYRTASNRNARPYSERLEMARRALLSALGAEAEGQRDRSSRVILPGSSSSSSSLQETTTPSSGNNSLDERNLENSSELPHTLRSLLASAEGRSGLISEQIRQIFDHMRSGEGVRFEDVMLGQSFIFEMADLNDRHHDMRMDVDDMSYEELLELGEQIGNVCTGLKEGTISSHMKQRKFAETQPKIETEPCSICREEYVEGEDVGTLDCGHDFHTDCVKQWLVLKNLCPVCKTTGLNLPD